MGLSLAVQAYLEPSVQRPRHCGDGIVQASEGEECDDKNAIDTDACTNLCKVAICTDGIVRPRIEQCDDGNKIDTDACTNQCKTARCGDGVLRTDGKEQCDDGNVIATDSCTHLCKNAKCGDEIVQTGVDECDDGNTISTDACTNLCKNAKCGDGLVQDGVEKCDDGNTNETDSCTNLCGFGPQIFTVNSTADEVDDNIGDGVCHTASNVCALRAAVQEANATDAQDEIIVPAGIYTLTIKNVEEEANENDAQDEEGDLDIKKSLIITGAGADVTTIIGGDSFDNRLFHIYSNAETLLVKFSGLTLDGNNINTNLRGGVVFFKALNNSVGTIEGCHIKRGYGTDGGGVSMNAKLDIIIRNSTISDNKATVRGGGLFCETGHCLILNSTFSNNTITGAGGGGAIENTAGTMTIIHSTFVNNTATDPAATGGALQIGEPSAIKNSIFVGNTAHGVANNCGGEVDKITSGGYNVSSDASCNFSGAEDKNSVSDTIVDTDLKNNGGKTPTHLLLILPTPPGNPAIDSVPVANCTDEGGNALTKDQRGSTRPANGNCDAGSVEMQ